MGASREYSGRPKRCCDARLRVVIVLLRTAPALGWRGFFYPVSVWPQRRAVLERQGEETNGMEAPEPLFGLQNYSVEHWGVAGEIVQSAQSFMPCGIDRADWGARFNSSSGYETRPIFHAREGNLLFVLGDQLPPSEPQSD